jgi:hypothetical protein
MALPALAAWARPLGLAVVASITGPIFAQAVQTARRGMKQVDLRNVVDGMLKPLGMGLLLLAAVA